MPHSNPAKSPAALTDTASVDRPVPAGVNAAAFGSDVIADAIWDRVVRAESAQATG